MKRKKDRNTTMLIHERTMNRKLAKPFYFSFHKKEPSFNRAEIIGV